MSVVISFILLALSYLLFLKSIIIYLYIYLFIYLFIYLCLAALGLRCCTWAFSSCGEWGLLFLAVRGLLSGGLSLLWSMGSRHMGFSSCGMQGLSSCGSRALECRL